MSTRSTSPDLTMPLFAPRNEQISHNRPRGRAVASIRRSLDRTRRRSGYMTPPYGLRADGPLMAGGCVGAGSGAGMRLSKAGVDGGDAPNSVVGSCAKPARPRRCTTPPRAKPGVEPTIQAAAKITAKRDFMAVTPILGLRPRVSIRAIHLGMIFRSDCEIISAKT